MTTQRPTADVIVLGASPAGLALAARLALADWDVLVLEPAEPMSGPSVVGASPQAVQEIQDLGVHPPATWHPSDGLRIIARGSRTEIPWPNTSSTPEQAGFTFLEEDLLTLLRARAVACGARLHTTHWPVEIRHDEHGRADGVRLDGADGNHTTSCRVLVDAVGVPEDVVTASFTAAEVVLPSLRHAEPLVEVWLDLPVLSDDGRIRPVPATGWIAAVGDGSCAVGVRVPRRVASAARDVLHRWRAGMPPDWGFAPAQLTPEAPEGANQAAEVGRNDASAASQDVTTHTFSGPDSPNISAVRPEQGPPPEQPTPDMIREWTFPRRRLRGRRRDGTLLVGRAAGVADWISGGVDAGSLQTARLAADAITQHLRTTHLRSTGHLQGKRDDDASAPALATYPRALIQHFGLRHVGGGLADVAARTPPMMRAFSDQVLPYPRLASAFVTLGGDRIVNPRAHILSK